MRLVATLRWSPRTVAARWRTRHRRVGGHGGPQLGRDLRCAMVHRPVRWCDGDGEGLTDNEAASAEEGGRGWGSTVVEEVSTTQGESEVVDLWLKWDGRRTGVA
jgi:hypothetical protein